MLFLGAQKGYPPWAVSPPQIKGRPPQLVIPSQPRWLFYMRASGCNQLSNELVQQLHISTLPDLSSSTSQICFCNVALFTTATTTAANTTANTTATTTTATTTTITTAAASFSATTATTATSSSSTTTNTTNTTNTTHTTHTTKTTNNYY